MSHLLFLECAMGLMLEIPDDFIPRLCSWVVEVTALRGTETCTQGPAALSSTLQEEIFLLLVLLRLNQMHLSEVGRS